MLKTSDGALVYWDGKEDLMIKVPNEFKSTTTGHRLFGLCGTYDGNPNNDFVDELGTQVNFDVFPEKWKEDIQCSSSPNPPGSCYSPTNNVEAGKLYAETECGIINENTFAACHHHVDPTPYMDMCIEDVCACNSTAKSDCACRALSLYSRVCDVEYGVKLEWRNSAFCGKYPTALALHSC